MLYCACDKMKIVLLQYFSHAISLLLIEKCPLHLFKRNTLKMEESGRKQEKTSFFFTVCAETGRYGF